MEWFTEWVRNLAFYFVFLTIIMNLMPGGEEKRYVRVFLGVLLLTLLFRPIFLLGNLETTFLGKTVEGSMAEEYDSMIRQRSELETRGTAYVKRECEKKIEAQLQQWVSAYEYELEQCEVTFFSGDTPEVSRIDLKLRYTGDSGKEKDMETESKKLKNNLQEVYNIPVGNINIVIQE